MTTPSQPTELDKAIDQTERYRVKRWVIPQTTVETLLLAAKRLKEVEKENEQLRTENTVFGMAATGCALIIQERDQLRAELKAFSESSNAVVSHARHSDDCYSQKTSPPTYSDVFASTCDCGLRESMIGFHKARANSASAAPVAI